MALDGTAQGMGAVSGSQAAALRAITLAILFPLVVLVLDGIGLGTLLVALEAVYQLPFWRRAGTVMRTAMKRVLPARAQATAERRLNASTNWRADWQNGDLFPQELAVFLSTATASAAELLGQVSVTTQLRNFTMRCVLCAVCCVLLAVYWRWPVVPVMCAACVL